MPIDLKTIDKKKLVLIVIAVAAGLVAIVIANGFITESVNQRASAYTIDKKEIEGIKQYISKMQEDNQRMMQQVQASVGSALQQRSASPSQPSSLGAKTPLAVKTPAGKRAVTVVIDKLPAVNGMVYPGDRVDIIATLSVPSGPRKTEKVTVTLFQNVLVLAVGRYTDVEPGIEQQQQSPSLPITFAFDPQEASLLLFAQKQGTLQLVLRSVSDNNAFLLAPTDWKALSSFLSETQKIDLKVYTENAVSKPAESASQVEIFRGGQ